MQSARRSLLAACVALTLAPALALADGLRPLNDSALSDVRGRDGVSFDLNGFSMNGDLRVSYTRPDGASIWAGNPSASRSDSATPFSDPYRFDVVRSTNGLADIAQFNLPQNLNGEQKWQLAYDFGVNADGIDRDGGSIVVSDLALYGGGWQFSTPRTQDGLALGVALRMDVGQWALRPNGRANMAGQMALDNIRIGATDENGNFTGQPWVFADVARQPALVNALADENGPRLHIGIGAPDAQYGTGQAASGGIEIGKISFTAPSGNVDLGSSRIGNIQINYLDIKFRQ
ncbi:DUF6160 family protein [Duganella sp. Root1480D1]|uniref:DUF6160 family protein n=1 Tax=Duganella sp. Root1480D1 TaxID=1736471 RepID=UPI00070C232B|nr:DUF6160 family protein [Duganella sp. Root1480D1]KQZ39588.1 hypothetical protein ASD58_04110 [Duganella sp. Root1480D1]